MVVNATSFTVNIDAGDLVSTDADDGYFEELGEQADDAIEEIQENYDSGYYEDLASDAYDYVDEQFDTI